MPTHAEKIVKEMCRCEEIRQQHREQMPVVIGEKDGAYHLLQGPNLVTIYPGKLSDTNKQLLREILERAK